MGKFLMTILALMGPACIVVVLVISYGGVESSTQIPSAQAATSNGVLQDQEPEPMSGWIVSRGKSEMDDTPKISVSKVAENSIEGWLKSVTPVLVIRCK